MRALLIIVALAVLALVAAMMLGIISIDQTRTASLPKVSVSGGQAPEFKADVGDVDLGTEQKTVKVPTVTTTNATIEVPTIQVERAEGAPAPKQ